MYHGRLSRANKKRKRHEGGVPVETGIGEDVRKSVRSRGGNSKVKLVSVKGANVLVEGKYVRCEVTWVKDNPASRDLTRRNVVTKGAVLDVKTPEGKVISARVLSRPGQDGVLNAVAL